MDGYVSRDEERRSQGQVFGTADELRVLRTISARANAMRRMSGSKQHGRQGQRLTSRRSASARVA